MAVKCVLCRGIWDQGNVLTRWFLYPSSTQIRGWSSKGREAGLEDNLPVRNVGVMAHIDAGKTTTTERMLYHAGYIRRMGDVDAGSTVMDFMKQERERGITINSAAISFNWCDHRINLIDTPGHIDFTFEVERSLRVLDGAVAILDASAGVEAQTLTVWRQASHFDIPRIVFVNKMDKPGASFAECVRSIEDKLDTIPLIIQQPLGAGKNFLGVIDLLSMDMCIWNHTVDGSKFSRVPLTPQDSETGSRNFRKLRKISEIIGDIELTEGEIEGALEARNNLAEQVVTLDNELLQLVASDSFDPLTLSDHSLRKGIQRLNRGRLATPILCGSSLRNIGVQLLLDGIVHYLPSPESSSHLPDALKDLCAYAFKVSYDKRRGHLVYLRIYTGQLRPQTTVHNITRGVDERVSRVLLMMANEQREMQSIGEGNIAVAVGMKNTYTGDTIVLSSMAAAAAKWDSPSECEVSLGVFDLPPPVFFCSIEPSSAAHQKDLEHALSCLSREDPSLRVSVNEDTAQTVLSGMGELHLEIVHDRLTRDYGVECSLGQLQVAYREAPTTTVTKEVSQEQRVGGKRHRVTCVLRLEPAGDGCHSNKPIVELKSGRSLVDSGHSKQEILEAVTAGVESACLQGPLLAFPVVSVIVTVMALSLDSQPSLTLLSACVSEGVTSALTDANVQLLEPCTELVVTVPEEHLGSVLSELSSQRRAQVKEVAVTMDTRTVCAHTPLAALKGYSTALRTMTSGTGTFSATFSHYEPVSKEQEIGITQSLRGY